MRTRVAASVAVVLSIALTVASSITSGLTQATSELGVLAGTIHDHTGTPVPGVTITLTGPERRTVITNPRGQFIVAGLLPGVYEALAELAGFRASVTKVTVVAGRTERVIVRMEVSTVQETVTVAAAPPPVAAPAAIGSTMKPSSSASWSSRPA